MITISAFKDREEALISKALLEAAGVPVTLKDEFGELHLQVRDTDAPLAQDVLVPSERSGWRRRGLRRIGLPSSAVTSRGAGRLFMKGGSLLVAAFLLLLLLAWPIGIKFEITPFTLLFVFVFGGCAALLRGFFRIRRKRVFRRSRLV